MSDNDWVTRYAEKSVQCDQLTGLLCCEADVRKQLCALAAQWHEESMKPGHFMPDELGDKIARTRTGACAEKLLQILSEEAKL